MTSTVKIMGRIWAEALEREGIERQLKLNERLGQDVGAEVGPEGIAPRRKGHVKPTGQEAGAGDVARYAPVHVHPF